LAQFNISSLIGLLDVIIILANSEEAAQRFTTI
jgi:hypothetical protein